MSQAAQIAIDPAALRQFCQRHHITKLSLFGSVLRDDFTADSDVDVLYVFDPNHVPGWEIEDIEQELSEIISRKVDLVSEKYLNPRIREQVFRSAEVIYAGN